MVSGEVDEGIIGMHGSFDIDFVFCITTPVVQEKAGVASLPKLPILQIRKARLSFKQLSSYLRTIK